MKTLWYRLKPEYKRTIEYHIKSGKFSVAPHYVKKSLENKCFFGELTIEELKNLFVWTDNDVLDIEWKDLFGERFLIKENK